LIVVEAHGFKAPLAADGHAHACARDVIKQRRKQPHQRRDKEVEDATDEGFKHKTKC
jgi:hypothetical protein